MPILPRIPSGRPLPSSRFHVTPLSSDRYKPLPGPPLEKNHGCRRACQTHANTLCGLCGGLPYAGGDCSKVVRVRLADDPFDRQRASAAKRTDLSPTHSIEQFFVDASGQRRSRGWSGLKRCCEKQYENYSNELKTTI